MKNEGRFFRTMLKSKIHRATVTDSNLNYEGSVTIDERLMKLTDILPYEEVAVYNVTNGERFYTYAIPGPENRGDICINGAAAHKAKKGDLVIIASFVSTDSDSIHAWKPRVVHVDAKNRPMQKNETPKHPTPSFDEKPPRYLS